MAERKSEKRESIIDASAPSAGRMYDYYLGGHHNFEVDRLAAQQVLALLPFVPKTARLQRWCLQDIAHELTEVRGYDVIIDFASGLPTNDHLHYVVPEGTTVIYSDYDPVIVEYAREILDNTPDVYYFEANARQPEELLNHPEVQDILGGRRRVALVYWGISIFLPDEALVHAAHALGDWAGPGSCWAFQAQMAGADSQDPAILQVSELYEQMGVSLFSRTMDTYKELLHPWRTDERGFISLLEWHSLDQSIMSEEDRRIYGPAGAGYGTYLLK